LLLPLGGYIGRATFRKAIPIDNRLSWVDCMGDFDAYRSVPAIVSRLGPDRRSLEHGIVCAWGSRQSHRRIRSNCGSDRRRPSLNSMSDPMATIENKVRSASGGQDPAALRDAAATAVRAALGEPAQQAAATDRL